MRFSGIRTEKLPPNANRNHIDLSSSKCPEQYTFERETEWPASSCHGLGDFAPASEVLHQTIFY